MRLRTVLVGLLPLVAGCDTVLGIQNTSDACPEGRQDHDGDGYCLPNCATASLTCGTDVCDDSSGVAVCAPPPMVAIPAGPFRMGSDPGEPGSADDERPEHPVTLSAYLIDPREVTNAEYRQCVTSLGCTPPSSPDSNTRADYYTSATYDRYPVINVSWVQAYEYCYLMDKRLPTEAEWEKAARGGCEIVAPSTCGPEDERTYPWGEAAPACDLANFDRVGSCVPDSDTDITGSRPSGASPYGVDDLAGNVWEWVQDYYSDTYYQTCAGGCADPSGPVGGSYRVIRGGAWDHSSSFLRVAGRSSATLNSTLNSIGFRCAMSL